MGLKEKDILKRVLFYGGNAIVALIFVSPLLWMIAASLKPEAQIFSDMSNIRTFWPTAATLGNYVEVFTRVNMMKFILNSLFYVFVIVILDLAVNSICGYALAKFDFPGKELLLTVVISLMVLPMEAIMLPLYKEVASLGWVNTWAGLIVPFVGKCFSIYMFRQFFLDIPDDLLEAAEAQYPVLAAGHYETEYAAFMTLKERLEQAFPDVEFICAPQKNPVLTV